MKVGEIVIPLNGFVLHCATLRYPSAVVISTNPLILTSEDSTMRWESTISDKEFEVTGSADEETLNNCLRRL